MNLNCLFQGAIFTSLHCKMKQILARAWIVNFTNASFRLYIFTKQVNSAILKRLRRLSDINRYHLCNPAQTGFEKVHWGMESCKEKKRRKGNQILHICIRLKTTNNSFYSRMYIVRRHILLGLFLLRLLIQFESYCNKHPRFIHFIYLVCNYLHWQNLNKSHDRACGANCHVRWLSFPFLLKLGWPHRCP